MLINKSTTAGAKYLNILDIVALLSAPGVGRHSVQQIFNTYRGIAPSRPQELHALLLDTMSNTPGARIPTETEVEKAYKNAERVLENAKRLGIQVLTPDNRDFPNGLRNIPDPPVVLYVSGNTTPISTESAVAVVGTRNPSVFGMGAAKKIGAALAEKGLIVVSGLAIGCDTASHMGCLQVGGNTAAVLAHGLDQIYPSQNYGLARNILDSGGWLVSEYPPGVNPRGHLFVERDRLQSGLSAAVIIIETDTKGGTMHTARFCLKQRRLLACLAHPPKFASHAKTRGNRALISEANAFPLADKEALEEFVRLFHRQSDDPQSGGTEPGTE